jgi:hypothetical protein
LERAIIGNQFAFGGKAPRVVENEPQKTTAKQTFIMITKFTDWRLRTERLANCRIVNGVNDFAG